MMTETDKAYLAAFIDGEGSISLNQCHRGESRTKSYVLRLRITNTDRSVLEWIAATVGHGAIIVKKRCKAKNGMTRPAWEWYLANKRASALLQEILPYMKIKRKQAELGIEYCESIGITPHNQRLCEDIVSYRRSCKDKMGLLNHPTFI